MDTLASKAGRRGTMLMSRLRLIVFHQLIDHNDMAGATMAVAGTPREACSLILMQARVRSGNCRGYLMTVRYSCIT